jgi:hypothetical protein
MEDLRDECKVNNRKFVLSSLVANVLKFKVIMGVAQLMYDLNLSDELDGDVTDLLWR